MTWPTIASRPMIRTACMALALASFLAPSAFAQDAPQDAVQPGTSADNPKAQSLADMFADGCTREFLPSMPDTIRDDAGKDASPLLIETMVDVAREGMCECFVTVIRAQSDDHLPPTLMDDLKPQFTACMAAALRPRMTRVCSESQRMQTDDSAPDCGCLATKVANMDDAALGAGANDLFDLLNSTRNIPTTAGALGEAARACAARPTK